MPVAHLAAVKALNSAAVLLFLTLLLLAAAKRLSTIIVLFAVQSAVLAADVVAVAYVHRIPEAYAIAALVFLTKVIGIPYALLKLLKRLQVSRQAGSTVSSALSVSITTGLIVLAFSAVHTYLGPSCSSGSDCAYRGPRRSARSQTQSRSAMPSPAGPRPPGPRRR